MSEQPEKIDYNILVSEAFKYTEDRQNEMMEKYKLDNFTAYNLDQEDARIVWSKDNAPGLSADFQIIGTFYPDDGSWMWGWANESFQDNIVADLISVAKFGEENELDKLYIPAWKNTQIEEAYELMAVCVYLLKAEGFYRFESDEGLIYFMLLREFKEETAE